MPLVLDGFLSDGISHLTNPFLLQHPAAHTFFMHASRALNLFYMCADGDKNLHGDLLRTKENAVV